MVKIIDDSRAIAFICNKLQDAKIVIPPSAHETLLSDYLKRIRRTLVQSHAEHEVDNYLTTLKISTSRYVSVMAKWLGFIMIPGQHSGF